jgi:hypothetical protein
MRFTRRTDVRRGREREIAARLNTRHLGLMPDFGTYCRRIPHLVLEESRRRGVREEIIAMAADAFHSPAQCKTLVERVGRANGTAAELWLARRVEIGVWINDDLRDLATYLPYCVHAHGKFYEMTEDLIEPDVGTTDMPILGRPADTMATTSEYEPASQSGHRPGYDEIEQVVDTPCCCGI